MGSACILCVYVCCVVLYSVWCYFINFGSFVRRCDFWPLQSGGEGRYIVRFYSVINYIKFDFGFNWLY